MADPAGWTGRLEFAPYQAITNGFHVPGRAASGVTSIFQTTPMTEQYFYCIEITPVYDRSGTLGIDRMTPILDDVQVVYMQWDAAVVIEEVELVD